MSIRPRQLARLGEFHLIEAVLDVLCEAYPNGYGIGAAEISKRTGIFRERGVVGLNDSIVHGLINQLFDQKKITKASQRNGKSGWILTEKEYERRRDDIEFEG